MSEQTQAQSILHGIVCHLEVLCSALYVAVPWTVAVLLLVVILIIALVPYNGKP